MKLKSKPKHGLMLVGVATLLLVVAWFGASGSSASSSILASIFGKSDTSTKPTIADISPTLGPVGTVVTVRGTNFSPTSNTIIFGKGGMFNVVPTTSSTLVFTLPAELEPSCAPKCKSKNIVVKPGSYAVSVKNEGGTSKSVKFLVRASSSASANTPTSGSGSQVKPNVISVKDFGAKGDGVADDAPAIQAALDSVRGTGGTIYFPSGTYLLKTIAGPLVNYPGSEIAERAAVMVRGSHVTLQGDGSTSILKLGQGLKAHALEVSYGSNIMIESLAFNANKPERNGNVPYPDGDVVSNVVSVVYSKNVKLSRVEVSNGIEDGIGFWQSEDGTVVDSYLHDNGTVAAGAAGVSYSGSIRGYIARNTVLRNTAVGIWVSFGSDTAVVEDNIVRDSSGNGIALGGFAPPEPFYRPSRKYTVRRNTVTDNGWNGIEALGVEDSTIENNTVLDNQGNGIVVANQEDDARYTSKRVKVVGNTASNSNSQRIQDSGIVVRAGSAIEVRKNTTADNGVWLGNQIFVEPESDTNTDWEEANERSYTNPK